MIKVEKVHSTSSNRNDADERLEERLNEIVGDGGKIMQILEVGDNYTTNHYTVIYEDWRKRS